MNNPFTISFGKVPENYIIRSNEVSTILGDLESEKSSSNAYIITGVKGSGKTSLLAFLLNEFKKNDNYIVVTLNSSLNLLESLASFLYEKGKLNKYFLSTEFNFSFECASIKIKGDNPIFTIETFITKIIELLTKKNKKIIIVIDEVVNDENMKQFTKFFQSLIFQDYNVMLLMTGLYDIIFKLQNDKSLTFLYRAPKIYMSSLNMFSIANIYKNVFNITVKEASKLAKETSGYAYAFQLLGYLLYENKETHLTQKILDEYDTYLFEYSYQKLWSELTDKEKQILKSINSNENVKIKEIAEKNNMTSQYFNVYKDRLIKKGILESLNYGYVKIVLPRFTNFISMVIDLYE